MRGPHRWHTILSAIFASLIVLLVMSWGAAEAPKSPVHSEESPDADQLAAIADEPMPAPTAIVLEPTATAPALVILPTATPMPQDVRVPILMYHRIDWLPPNADLIRKSLSILPPDFDSQVRLLKERGFTSVTLYDLYAALQGKLKLPPKPVVLTFDDGYADNYANAFPVLQRYAFSGTFFIITDFVGTGEYMSWSQLKEMSAAGMKIEAHGRTHPDLTKLNAAGVASQAAGAKAAIQSQIGITPRFYCYPSGKYNTDVMEIVKANGYWGAVSINYGIDHTLPKAFELKRVRIDGRESFAAFARKVGENP